MTLQNIINAPCSKDNWTSIIVISDQINAIITMKFTVEKHMLCIVSRRKYVLSNSIDPIKVCIYIFLDTLHMRGWGAAPARYPDCPGSITGLISRIVICLLWLMPCLGRHVSPLVPSFMWWSCHCLDNRATSRAKLKRTIVSLQCVSLSFLLYYNFRPILMKCIVCRLCLLNYIY